MWMLSSASRWPPSQRDELVELMKNSKEVLQCYHVTGAYTFLIKVSCGSMPQLEHLILQFQKLGTTSTQIILSTPVNHGDLEADAVSVHRTVTLVGAIFARRGSFTE